MVFNSQKPLPTLNSYEDLPQKENGVGSIRSFLKAMDEATRNLPIKNDPNKEHAAGLLANLLKMNY